VRIVALNLRATPSRRLTALAPLLALLDRQHPDVVLLQECRKGWTELVCQELGLEGVSTHELLEGTAGLPADGCAIGVRPPLRTVSARCVEPGMFMPAAIETLIGPDTPSGYEQLPGELLVRFRARSLIARIVDGPWEFAAGSFHATPGMGRYGPKPGSRVRHWKPFFHGGVAAALAALTLPFVFAIDANEPLAETLDSITFHWRPGTGKLAALLGLRPEHRARDLLPEHLRTQAGASGRQLPGAYLHHPRGRPCWSAPVRFDVGHPRVRPSGLQHTLRGRARRGHRSRHARSRPRTRTVRRIRPTPLSQEVAGPPVASWAPWNAAMRACRGVPARRDPMNGQELSGLPASAR
jgi:hypothetical protein